MQYFQRVNGVDQVTVDWVNDNSYIFDMIPSFSDLDCKIENELTYLTSNTQFMCNRNADGLMFTHSRIFNEEIIARLDELYDRQYYVRKRYDNVQRRHTWHPVGSVRPDTKVAEWRYERRNPLHHEQYYGTIYKHWSLK